MYLILSKVLSSVLEVSGSVVVLLVGLSGKNYSNRLVSSPVQTLSSEKRSIPFGLNKLRMCSRIVAMVTQI